MNIVTPKAEILFPKDGDQAKTIVELAARTCYKSETNMTPESASAMVRSLILKKHFAMLEHASATVRFIVDRGVSHELVRHRIASFAQESTRYCNYSKDRFGNEISVISIDGGLALDDGTTKLCTEEILDILVEWEDAMKDANRHYLRMIKLGATPQIARSVLPMSVKTELVITANLREWRHFLELRYLGTTGKPHPQMLEVTEGLFYQFKNLLPDFFFDMEDF